MAPVRFGVLGTGNIGKQHIALLRSGDIHGAVLTATASRSGEAIDSTTPHFQNLDALLDAQLCDVLLIATPTMSHVEAAQSAMDRGLHVLLEKPLAMSVLQSQSLIDNAPSNIQFSVMLNQRFHPAYATLKRLLDEGVIGGIQRYSWTMTSWYRPDIYYQVSSWRGTWPGEGGGFSSTNVSTISISSSGYLDSQRVWSPMWHLDATIRLMLRMRPPLCCVITRA